MLKKLGVIVFFLVSICFSMSPAIATPQQSRPALKLDWPVLGTLIKRFGRQLINFKPCSYHTGIDIRAQRWEVKAAAAGQVLFQGWLKGYGKVVIIDHGRGYSTVYAHMSAAQVKKGEVVSSGSVIGAVGNTGTSAGYHLHFEVRQGSTPKNPLNYLEKAEEQDEDVWK